MYKYLLAITFALIGNSTFAKSAEAIFLDMAVADNVGALYVFDEEDDPNKQLGRPNQIHMIFLKKMKRKLMI